MYDCFLCVLTHRSRVLSQNGNGGRYIYMIIGCMIIDPGVDHYGQQSNMVDHCRSWSTKVDHGRQWSTSVFGSGFDGVFDLTGSPGGRSPSGGGSGVAEPLSKRRSGERCPPARGSLGGGAPQLAQSAQKQTGVQCCCCVIEITCVGESS